MPENESIEVRGTERFYMLLATLYKDCIRYWVTSSEEEEIAGLYRLEVRSQHAARAYAILSSIK